ncbi:MAG: hypothetical protein V7L27_07845 [Nostoc sp.]|uniref:hypothetical protein n=1 Tax=Nostoc sp. TaxID=1180 RepID=UPI002FFC9073
MQQSQDANTPKQLNREQRWEIVRTLLQRSNLSSEAKQAFRQAYANARRSIWLTFTLRSPSTSIINRK